MKTYGHVFPIGPSSTIPCIDSWGHEGNSSHGVYGAFVATTNFLKHLLQHSEFDQYHFFVPDAALKSDHDLRAKMLGKMSGDSRISLKGFNDLATVTHKDYQAFHHCEGLRCLSLLATRNLQVRSRTPITAVTHSISYQEFLGDLALHLTAGLQPWDSMVCTSTCGRKVMRNLLDYVAERIQKETGARISYQGRLDVIPLGVNTELFRPREKRELRRLLELPSDKLILLWFGRFSLCDKADLCPLLLAFKKLCAKYHGDDLLLLMAGEDVRRGDAKIISQFAAEIGIADKVLVRRNPTLASGPLYYSASDVFLCPSDNVQETFGQTVIEAMASGLPVICSDWDGYRDTVVHGKTGFRIPTYWAQCDSKICHGAPITPWPYDHLYLSQSVSVDVPEMANAMLLLARNRQLRDKMGLEARHHAVENFDWKVVINQYEKLWKILNATAESAPPRTSRRATWLKPSYVRHFRSYPTRMLEPSDQVKTSRAISRRPKPEEAVYPNMGMRSSFRAEVADSILKYASGGASVRELQRRISKSSVTDEDVLWYILYLLKYDYLCLPGRQGQRGGIMSV